MLRLVLKGGLESLEDSDPDDLEKNHLPKADMAVVELRTTSRCAKSRMSRLV